MDVKEAQSLIADKDSSFWKGDKAVAEQVTK
jgi:hypothetical protein